MMINLLPPEKKSKIKKEKTYILFTFLVVYLLLFLFSFSGTLYALSIFTEDMLKREEALLQEKEVAYFEIVEKESLIEKVNEVAPRINSFYEEQTRITDLLKTIASSFSEKSHIVSFRLTEDDDRRRQITLEGYAKDWEELIYIEDNLKKNFDEVSFSPGVWAQVSDINFTVTFYK